MKVIQKILNLKWLASTAALLFLLAAPQNLSAHGELQIQIGLLTKKINAATNPAAQLYLDRAELHRDHKDWDAAESDYERAAQLDPKLPVDFYRAKMLDDSGELKSARKLFDKILKRSPKNGEAFIGRARVFSKLGKHKSAIADFRRGLELSPSPQPEYLLELAQVFVVEGKTNEALRTLDHGIKNFGLIDSLQGYALDLELSQKNNAGALARIDTLIESTARKENLLAQRGDILLAANHPTEAQKSFESALAAIKLLPSVLQKAPPMQNLQSHINSAMQKISNTRTSKVQKNSVAEISN